MDGALCCLPTALQLHTLPALAVCLLHSIRSPTQGRLSLTEGIEEGKKGRTPLSDPLVLIPFWFC